LVRPAAGLDWVRVLDAAAARGPLAAFVADTPSGAGTGEATAGAGVFAAGLAADEVWPGVAVVGAEQPVAPKVRTLRARTVWVRRALERFMMFPSVRRGSPVVSS
jgi:hypothetical protein